MAGVPPAPRPMTQNFLNIMQFFFWKIWQKRLLVPPWRAGAPSPNGNLASAPGKIIIWLHWQPLVTDVTTDGATHRSLFAQHV